MTDMVLRVSERLEKLEKKRLTISQTAVVICTIGAAFVYGHVVLPFFFPNISRVAGILFFFVTLAVGGVLGMFLALMLTKRISEEIYDLKGRQIALLTGSKE